MTQDFKQIQHELAAWLRSERQPDEALNAIEPRRLAIYRRLIHNNIRQFLDAGFPVLKEVLAKDQWQALVDSFIAQHHANSPLFSEIGAEFVQFLATLDVAQCDANELPPWLFELAHYERLEVDVLHADFDENLRVVGELSDDTVLYLNPTAVVAIYYYPVAQISRTQQPDTQLAEPYCALVYRQPEAEVVSFMQINTLTAYALEQLRNQPQTFTQLFEGLQVQFPNYAPEQLAQGLLALIQDFCERFVLFTKP
ncbi:DNA-binding domain-containing protein [Pseudidiomarina homiensis]|uniref:HvfC family RiPP maturation protein n=1 Tax=Pseudidiomarina homiensis TaxID=364198 RepID=UPI0018E55CE3|nr:putative DNA-binding domain-containing protein [Pseudidiomarina homiensis]